MDDEDRGEFGIAPKYVQTHSEFSGQKRHRATFHDGPIPGNKSIVWVLLMLTYSLQVRHLITDQLI